MFFPEINEYEETKTRLDKLLGYLGYAQDPEYTKNYEVEKDSDSTYLLYKPPHDWINIECHFESTRRGNKLTGYTITATFSKGYFQNGPLVNDSVPISELLQDVKSAFERPKESWQSP